MHGYNSAAREQWHALGNVIYDYQQSLKLDVEFSMQLC